MSDHSLIFFQEEVRGDTVVYAVVYQSNGGTLKGVGRQLAGFLKKVVLVRCSEIVGNEEEGSIVCYGFGDLVARFIRKFKKDESCDFYLFPANASAAGTAEAPSGRYTNYFVTFKAEEGICVQVYGLQADDAAVSIRMSSKNSTIQMSVDRFVEICGSLPCQPGESLTASESRTANVNLEGSILNWTNPFRYVVGGQGVPPYGARDNELLKNYRIIARAEPGTMPIRKAVNALDTTYNLDDLGLQSNTRYEIHLCGIHHIHKETQISSVMKYKKSVKLQDELSYRPYITGSGSLIFFETEKTYAAIYQQWGGDLDAVGLTLATFLKSVKIVNSCGLRRDRNEITCMGFGDMVARYIRMIKEDKALHRFSVCPNITDLAEQEYNYYVRSDGINLRVQVNNEDEMSIDQFVKSCEICKKIVKPLKTQCTSVVMTAILQQGALMAEELPAALPLYVPTVVKNAIVQAIFRNTAVPVTSTLLCTNSDSPPPAKRMAPCSAYTAATLH